MTGHLDPGADRRSRLRRDGFSPSTFTAVAVTALVLLVAIVVTGGAVRLTGSGLGCEDWPNCNDETFVDLSSRHAAIEQINRLFTFLVGVGVLLAALAAWFRRPRRRDLVVLGSLLLAGVPAQGLVGAIVVWTDLHPATVQLHFVLSMLLVWAAVMLLVRSREPDGSRRAAVSSTTRRLVVAVTASTAITVLLGTVVTGTGPHSGDERSRRFFGTTSDIDGEALRWVTRVHGAAVWLTVASVLLLVWRVRRSPDRRRVEGALSAWMVTALVQGGIGYVQYAAALPVALVLAHLTGATVLVGVTARLWCATTTTATDAPVPLGAGDVTSEVASGVAVQR